MAYLIVQTNFRSSLYPLFAYPKNNSMQYSAVFEFDEIF